MTAPAQPDAALFALLGRIFATELEPGFLSVLQTEGIREIFENVESGSLDVDIATASAEYQRLFVSPAEAPPLASAYIPDQSETISTLVDKVNSALALEFPEELPNDHAGVLFALMAWLLETNREAANEFARVALIPWLTDFGDALEEHSSLPLYTTSGKLLLALEQKFSNPDQG